MGYMGLGMQKWIYTMKPRRPYSMERKGSFTSVPLHKSEFKLQPSKDKGNSLYFLYFVIIIALCLFVILSKDKWLEHSEFVYKEKLEIVKEQEAIAFDFLFDSGISRFHARNYEGAYSEFKLAYNINPNNAELNDFLEETLFLLCFDQNKHCEDLDNYKF